MDTMTQNTLKLLENCIEEMNKKKDLTPSDLEMLCKAYKLKRELEDPGMSGGSYAGYYDRIPMPNTNGRPMGDWHAEGSYAPMRSPVTGRYVSRDGYGMSSHSLKDRMIAKLEGMYDEAQSEYEREEIRKEIRQIEANK